MTLQVVLRGSDGIVVASDIRATNFNPETSPLRNTDQVSKIEIVNSSFVYLFAGDECAKKVGAAIARAVGENPRCLTQALIEEISNSTLNEYRRLGPTDRVDYRKVIWVYQHEANFFIWVARCLGRDATFEATQPPVQCGKISLFAGDESNPARYLIEEYYNGDRNPLRNTTGLKTMAAHVIQTGATFSPNVDGLEMVVGDNKGFARVSQEEIQELTDKSREIHKATNSYFMK